MKSQRVRHSGVTNTLTFFQRAIWGFPDGPVVKNSLQFRRHSRHGLMDMNLSKLWVTVDRGTWHAAVLEVTEPGMT